MFDTNHYILKIDSHYIVATKKATHNIDFPHLYIPAGTEKWLTHDNVWVDPYRFKSLCFMTKTQAEAKLELLENE